MQRFIRIHLFFIQISHFRELYPVKFKVKPLLSNSERPCFMAQSMYHKAWPSESDYSLHILIILQKKNPDQDYS
jgi:hypothetical protein